MIIQKLLLLVVPLLLLVEAQNNPQRAFTDNLAFRRPVRPEFRPVRDIQHTESDIPKPGDEFSGIITNENIPILRKSYLTQSTTSENENPDITIYSEYPASGASSTSVSSGFGKPTRKPLWSKRTSTSYFSRRSYDTPTTTMTQNIIKPEYLTTQRIEPIEPVSAVTNQPVTLEIVTYQSNKKIFDEITPTQRNKPERTFYTSNMPITGWTATTELPETTSYAPSELDAFESSTQADVVSNEKEIEVLTTLTAVKQLNDYTCRNVNEYYSVPNHCDEYVECENNIAEWHSCPEGLYFDSKKKWPAFPCAYSFEVQCQIQSITSTSYVAVTPKGPEIIKGAVAIPAEIETIKPGQTIYYVTDYSTPATKPPTRKTFWSRQSTQISSDKPTTTITPNSYEPPFSQESVGSYTINGMYEADTSESVTSKSYETIELPESSAQADVVSNEKVIEVLTRLSPSPIIQSDAVKQLYDYTCRNVNEYYSVPNHCEEYVECENNIAKWHSCPEGLNFDSKKKWPAFPCAYPFEVQCQIQSITSTSYVAVTPKGPEIIKGAVAIPAEIETIKPGQTIYYDTDYSTPATKPPTRKPLWSRQSTQISSDKPTTTITPNSYEPPFSQESVGSYTINGMYEADTSESVTSKSYETIELPESSAQANVVSNEKVIEVLTRLSPSPIIQSDAVKQLYDYTCRNVNEYYSVPNQCEEYVECENNIAEWHSCPEGLYFDSKKKWPAFPCAYPFEVQCQIQSIISTSYVDVTPKGPEIIKGSAEIETIKPGQTINYYTDYSTPATVVPPTRRPLWSRQTTKKSNRPESYIRTTYAIFDPKDTLGSNTIIGMYPPATSQSVTSESYQKLPVDISSTYKQPETETPEPSSLPTEIKDDGSNGTPTGVSVTYIPSQNIPDISPPNIISPSSPSRPEIIEVTNQESASEPNWNELPAQTTAQNSQRPTWNFPSRPSYAAQASTSITPTSKPIIQPIIDLTTRPTIPQRPLQYYAVNQLNDYTCRDVNGYYSVSNQCDEYIECVNNKAYRNLCPDGLHFDPKAKWPAYPCAYPSEVKCESQSIIQQAHPTDQCPHRYGIFPIPNGDCGHYIVCQEGLATLMPCPSGLAFNPITSTCDWLVNVPGCNLDAFRDFTCPSDENALISHFISYYKYRNSCRQYIICQEGRPRLLSCDAGLSFDEKTNQCVNSDLIENCQNIIYE